MIATRATGNLEALPSPRRRTGVRAVLYATVASWLVTVLGFLGDDARTIGWGLGPFAAIASLALLVRGARSERGGLVAVVAVAVVAAVVGVAGIRNPWHLTVANDSTSFAVPLAAGAVVLAEVKLIRLLSDRRWLAVLVGALAAVSACVAAFLVAVAGLFLVVFAAPWWPSDEHLAPDGSFSVEVRPTFEARDNAVYVRSGSGLLQHERRIASSGTYEKLPGIRFEPAGRISIQMPLCERTVTVDPSTLEVIDDSHEPHGADWKSSPATSTC